MEEKIYDIVSSVIKMSADELKENANETGLWDSLKRVEIIFALEEEFDIAFEQDELTYMNTVSKIIETVNNKTE